MSATKEEKAKRDSKNKRLLRVANNLFNFIEAEIGTLVEDFKEEVEASIEEVRQENKILRKYVEDVTEKVIKEGGDNKVSASTAASILGINLSTWHRMVKDGRAPARLEGEDRWYRSEVMATKIRREISPLPSPRNNRSSKMIEEAG